MASFSQRGLNRPHLFRERSAVLAILAALTGQLLVVPVVAALTPQTITFSLPASGLVGASRVLGPTADSELAVTVASSTPAVCTIADTTLSLDAVGTCTVTASQAGDAAFDPAADVVVSMTVEAAPPITDPQTITFTLPASGFVGSNLTLAPTADSGLNVSVVTSTPAVCTIDVATLTLDAVGTCTVTASQAGDAAFEPAADVVVSMSVEPVPPVRSPQTITFSLPASGFLGSALPLSPSADSGLAVTVASSTPAVCTIDVATLSLVTVGTCTVTASQIGDASFEPAADVVASITVLPRSPQAITFSLPASGFLATTLPLSPTADSGLTVTVASSTPTACAIELATLTLLAAGTCTVTASQAGNAAFEPAADVVAVMTVEPPSPQTITFSLPASGLLGATLNVAPTADSGLTVTLVSSTPAVCTIDSGTLTLGALGTCTITASQAGSPAFEPAADVIASMTVEPVPQAIDLGRYAVNGTVRALAVDATTGRTYLGGDFTEIGLRTGPVAIVNPPETGSGTVLAASPEVLGKVMAVIADDRPGDPGFFIVGELIAVNGEPVPNDPVLRMHLDDSESRWVVDPGWAVSPGCTGPSLIWTTSDRTLVFGQFATSANPTGLATIDRLTGACSFPAMSTLAPLPSLASCAALPYCSANVTQLTWDDATDSLIVAYSSVSGATGNTIVRQGTLASYDLGVPGGARRWITALQSDPPADVTDWYGSSTGIAVAGGAMLVRGYFPLEPTDLNGSTASRLISVDPTTGAILQRWNPSGEQDLSDGTTIGPASDCLTGQSIDPFFSVDGAASQWVQKVRFPDILWMLCQYGTTDGSVSASQVGTWTLTLDPGQHLPSTFYRSGATDYVLGPDGAIDIATGDPAGWHPDPGMPFGSYAPTIAISSGGIVFGGDFTFVRGRPSPGVAALDASLDVDPAFVSPLIAYPPPDVRALALDQGWLVVGGLYFAPSFPEVKSIVALDPLTGAMMAWDPSPAPPEIVRTIAVNPSTGDFWVGGPSIAAWGAPGTALIHYASPADGAGPLGAPSLSCLDAPVIPEVASSTVLCAPEGTGQTDVSALAFDAVGRLYLGGAFGAVDGQARRGLARLDASGTVDDWSADLLGVLPMPAGSGLWNLEPYAFATHGNQILVGGRFCYATPNPTGGGALTCVSPLLVFSATSGLLLRPTDAAVSPWFPVFGWWSSGYGIVAGDSGVAVALGDVGVAVLDPTTLDFNAGASSGLLNNGWWAHDYRYGVFVLAIPRTPPTDPDLMLRFSPRIAASADAAPQIVLGGSIASWGTHPAGNLVRAVIGVTYTVTVATSGTGSGTVTSSPGSIACGLTCSTEIGAGASVTLSATPAAGSTFSGWSGGGCSGTAPCTIVVDAATDVTATFTADAPVTYTVTVATSGTGSGTVTSSPGSIACGLTCSTEIGAGASVTLNATPTAGSTFSGWSGGGCSGTAPCTIVVNAATDVTATFTADTPIGDTDAPTAAAPGATLRAGVALSGTSIPVTVTWTGSDTGGSGVARYELERSANSVTWTAVTTTLASTLANVIAPSSGTVRFRVRAVDNAGNVGAWATGPTLTPRLLQQNSTLVKYHGTWTNTSSASYCGGSAKYATRAGAYATYIFTGRSIALITTKARLRGKVKIYVNGVYQATVDMYSSSTMYRMLAWQKTWTTYATRTVKLVVVGGGSRPRFDLDAFATLK